MDVDVTCRIKAVTTRFLSVGEHARGPQLIFSAR